jgi:hypothetical protein
VRSSEKMTTPWGRSSFPARNAELMISDAGGEKIDEIELDVK